MRYEQDQEIPLKHNYAQLRGIFFWFQTVCFSFAMIVFTDIKFSTNMGNPEERQKTQFDHFLYYLSLSTNCNKYNRQTNDLSEFDILFHNASISQ